ncbi:MAG: DUF359 domain-containing protein [Candidatus Thorarchaeota archaeon]
MNNGLRIPENQRFRFSQPLGKLIIGSRDETIIGIEREIKDLELGISDINFYLVGDIVTQDFLNNTYLRNFIRLCIIDEKTQRSPIKMEFEDFFESIVEFENPKGVIMKKSFQILKSIIESSKRTLLKIIEGEEDLLVLPLISVLALKAPIKHIVFYGQPPITDSKTKIPEGIVKVDVDKKIQKTVNQFLKIMQNY